MDWMALRAYGDGQFLLEKLCSQLASDIHQFNRLPESLRQDPLALPAMMVQEMQLWRGGPRNEASVLMAPKERQTPNMQRPPLCALRAREADVQATFRQGPYMEITATVDPPEPVEWKIECPNDGRTETGLALWQVSREILAPFLHPPA